jgi:hypothetical protein
METYATRCAEWIEKQVRAAEQQDPLLRPLKDRINALAEQIKSASGDEQITLIRQQDQVIRDLIAHVASKREA